MTTSVQGGVELKKLSQHAGPAGFYQPLHLSLKGLSYEIDFENIDKNWQIVPLIRAAAGFRIFRRHIQFFCKSGFGIWIRMDPH